MQSFCFCSLNMQILRCCRCRHVVHLKLESRDFKIVHNGRLGRLDELHVTQNPRDIWPSCFQDGMFRRVSRRGIYGENGKNSSILIRTISGFSFICIENWSPNGLNMHLVVVCLALSIAEMKKSSENSEFIHRHHSATWRLKLKFACSQCSVIHNPPWHRKKAEKKGKRDNCSRIFCLWTNSP